jgi:hypothetical protein
MTDITTRLRSIYVAEGSNYVQEAADLIECLRAEMKALVNDVHSCHAGCTKAGCVNVRLQARVKMLEDALGDIVDTNFFGGPQAKRARAALRETK